MDPALHRHPFQNAARGFRLHFLLGPLVAWRFPSIDLPNTNINQQLGMPGFLEPFGVQTLNPAGPRRATKRGLTLGPQTR